MNRRASNREGSTAMSDLNEIILRRKGVARKPVNTPVSEATSTPDSGPSDSSTPTARSVADFAATNAHKLNGFKYPTGFDGDAFEHDPMRRPHCEEKADYTPVQKEAAQLVNAGVAVVRITDMVKKV